MSDYGRLTVLRVAETRRQPGGGSYQQWEVRCECGTVKLVGAAHVRAGRILSCGCLHREMAKARFPTVLKPFTSEQSRLINTTHGMSRTPLFGRWIGMRVRCNPKYWVKNPTYTGVLCSPLWELFEGFSDNPPPGRAYEPGLVLARFGDKGNYEPSNCRWATRSENSRENIERVMIRLSDGRFAWDVAKSNGISRTAMHSRLIAGVDPYEAVTRPMEKRRKHVNASR